MVTVDVITAARGILTHMGRFFVPYRKPFIEHHFTDVVATSPYSVCLLEVTRLGPALPFEKPPLIVLFPAGIAEA
ncbi:MAG: hypothetical protein ACI4PZ_00065 [Akkermansia sp.]